MKRITYLCFTNDDFIRSCRNKPRCRFGFGYRNRKFPRKETGVYTQGNDSVYVRKPEYPPLETPVPTGRNNSTEGRKPARAPKRRIE